MSIYLRLQCKKRVKIIVSAWNDKFELPDSSYSVPDIHSRLS